MLLLACYWKYWCDWRRRGRGFGRGRWI